MRPEQRIIADWIERVREKKKWSYAEWARKAGLGAATTVTRALTDDYKSVTSVPTLHELAVAAGEPSVLDFLQGGAAVAEARPVISEAALASLLAALLPLAPSGRATERSLRVLAAALQHGLQLLGDHASNPDNDAALEVAARGAVARFRDLLEQ